jgi:hypothetical protein
MSYWKPISVIAVVIGLIATGALAQSQPKQGQPMGPGMMGPGMMGPAMMGPGMMNQGMMMGSMMGSGMMPGMMMGSGMGPCGMMGSTSSAPLTVDQVKQNLGQWLTWQGNPRLKLGAVTEQKDGTITADITTQEGSLVQKLVIDKTHGWMRQAP